jgi:hypothetical protein
MAVLQALLHQIRSKNSGIHPWVHQSISSNNQGYYVKYTQQKSSASFLSFFEKSAKNSAAEIFMGATLCFAAEISASWQHCPCLEGKERGRLLCSF